MAHNAKRMRCTIFKMQNGSPLRDLAAKDRDTRKPERHFKGMKQGLWSFVGEIEETQQTACETQSALDAVTDPFDAERALSWFRDEHPSRWRANTGLNTVLDSCMMAVWQRKPQSEVLILSEQSTQFTRISLQHSS